MLFQNLNFLLLCGLAWLCYWRWPRLRLGVLAIANAVFYLAAGWANLLLFVVASAGTYWLGRRVSDPGAKWALWAGVGLNVANLAFFKYALFLSASLHAALPLPILDPGWAIHIVLPIGISFYTFQHISYLIDRRTRGLEPAPNYLHFWVYISFFGHSVAGPIMRGHEFLPQVAAASEARPAPEGIRYGLALFALGLSKKLLVADSLAAQVDLLFGRAGSLSFGEAWVAAVLFAFQIYFDFSAYSDMAVGIGHMFGFRLPQNFRTPYLSADPAEFWRRWHVTLSSWIRDYVYIPLGGSRSGMLKGTLAVLIAMLVSGLWHGAAWTFVAWGAYHGLLLVGHRAWRKLKGRLGWDVLDGKLYHMFAVAGFFVLTCLGWVLFRATSFADAAAMLRAMVDLGDIASLGQVKRWLALSAVLFALHVIEFQFRQRETQLGAWWRRFPSPIRGMAYGGMAFVWMIAYASPKDFLYFKF
jgi:alginate O-acetyltransferase complex protein AlgI